MMYSHADLAFPSAADFQFADDADFTTIRFLCLTDFTNLHRFFIREPIAFQFQAAPAPGEQPVRYRERESGGAHHGGN